MEISLDTLKMVLSDLSEPEKGRKCPCYSTRCNNKKGCGYIAIFLWFLSITLLVVGFGLGIGLKDMERRHKSRSSGKNKSARQNILVRANYKPWGVEAIHNGDGYVRKYLSPQYTPTLGVYEDSKSDSIAHHFRWSRQANIALWIITWWGPYKLEDSIAYNATQRPWQNHGSSALRNIKSIVCWT